MSADLPAQSTEELLADGRRLLDAHDHDAAEPLLSAASESGNPEAAAAYGELLIATRRVDEAVPWLERGAGWGLPCSLGAWGRASPRPPGSGP
ncbi:tetratricopeptide repeat protein [Streptomyces inhibens]|uniref:tetratricopeptide repeat protein n=1 Tax=Streptomyces inhibens TaxID=2293571 RepID=UPI001EE69C6E|nr:tetratricopeptide repeat protein [Streptomyces inhibens]UKY54582.1 tetratricopeptide repeat protein [Streptomyces inhibens]